jgi:hypothetical protein
VSKNTISNSSLSEVDGKVEWLIVEKNIKLNKYV